MTTIKKYNATIKKCDKCGALTTKNRVVKRMALYTNMPFYEYFGFDLCEDCEKKLRFNLRSWLKK